MNGHPQFDENLELLALGVLEGDEQRTLERHLSGCAECSGKLQEARGWLAVLSLAAPQERAPERVRASLLRQARADAAKLPRTPVQPRWRRLTFALGAVALVSIVMAVRVAIQNRDLLRKQGELQAHADQLQREATSYRAVLDLLSAPETLKVTLVSGPAKPVPQGKAFYHPQKGLLFYAADLPAAPSNRTYQLWLIPAQGNPISAGVFEVDPHGNGQVILPSLPAGIAAKAFAVTVEPAGGVPQPTGPKVLVGVVS